MPRNAASKIGNGVMASCRCNLNRKELSSASNTAVVVIFQTFVNGDVVYAETWEVLTLKNPIEPP